MNVVQESIFPDKSEAEPDLDSLATVIGILASRTHQHRVGKLRPSLGGHPASASTPYLHKLPVSILVGIGQKRLMSEEEVTVTV